jgi:hypothetical protein
VLTLTRGLPAAVYGDVVLQGAGRAPSNPSISNRLDRRGLDEGAEELMKPAACRPKPFATRVAVGGRFRRN